MGNQNRNRFEEAFGLHLTLDGYGCDYDSLNSIDKIYEFLDTTPDLISMTKIMHPYVFKYTGKVPEDWGLSGFVLIAESHISIHTFPEKEFFSLDIFSCKRFDLLSCVDLVKKFFQVKRFESNVLNRGLEFPRNMKQVSDFICEERKEINLPGAGR